MNFLIVNSSLVYNVIRGRPALNYLQTLTSTYHLMVKLPTPGNIDKVRATSMRLRGFMPWLSREMRT